MSHPNGQATPGRARIEAGTLRAELKRLRRGIAMRHPDVATRLEPQTMIAFGVDAGDTVPVVRRKVAAHVSRILTGHGVFRTAALAALALHPQAYQRNLTDRESWLASHLHCDARTARRHVSRAFDRLVDELAEADHATDLPERSDDDGFAVSTFWATMRLNTPRPQLHEKREIVVTGDRLEAIRGRLTVPRSGSAADNDVIVEAGKGGEIVEFDRRSPEDFEFTLRMPRVLRHGETHVYELIFTIPEGQPMRPHYVFQPLVPCVRFELTVQFDRARIPADVWLINGVTPRLLDHDLPSAPRVVPSTNGTVRRSFTELRQGMAYGVGWRPAA